MRLKKAESSGQAALEHMRPFTAAKKKAYLNLRRAQNQNQQQSSSTSTSTTSLKTGVWRGISNIYVFYVHLVGLVE